MDIILLAAIAAAVFFLCSFINKKTKLSPQIFYLLIGIILGPHGMYHLIGNTEIVPHLQSYNTILLMIMFFGSGLSFNVQSVLKAGKTNGMMLTIPGYVEMFVTAAVIFGLLSFFPIQGYAVTLLEAVFITSILSNSSPINTVPACVRYNMQGLTGKNRITDTMLVTTALDGFTAMPFILCFVVLAVTVKGGKNINIGMVALIFIAVLIAFVVVLTVSILLGKLLALIFRPLSTKLMANGEPGTAAKVIYTLVMFLPVGLIIANLGPVAFLGPLLAVGAGIGVQLGNKTGTNPVISQNCSKISTIFGAPMIIMFVAARIDFAALRNPTMVAILIAVVVITCVVKGVMACLVLKEKRFTSGDRKFAVACFIPKGIGLINMTVIFLPILSKMGMTYVTDFMAMLAGVSVVLTFPVGLTLINGAGGKWLTKEGADQ